MAAYAALASLAQTTHPNTNQGQYLFSVHAEEKIRSIHEYVIFLLSFLQDFPEKSNRWEGKVRDVAYETQDVIEQSMWQQSYYRGMDISSVKFDDQLKNLTEKFCLIAGDMMDERPAYSPLPLSSSSSRVSPTVNDEVIGLRDDVMAVKDRLCGLSPKLQVIPIVGMGGIGKTTLVRTVYDDPVIVDHFQIRVWLTISQDYSSRKNLLALLDSLNLIGEHMSRQEIDDFTMVEKVYQNLIGRRYLIVMDDVWSTKVWDDVRNIFPDDGNGSRIMLTSRLCDVAAYPDSNSPLHEMRFMNDSQSWDLLKGKVFTNRDCPPELEDVGEEISRSCVGLPLVVVLVAGVLAGVNETRASWEKIARSVKQVVVGGLEEILSLSYTNLPHHLRPCFLFIGIFPEDENIHASKLIKLWLAEGFLKHENKCNKSLEDEAEEYLEDLVKRNLVIVTSRKKNGKIKCCSLHDMVRDLCIRKGQDEKFLRVVDGCVVPQYMMNERRISFKLSNIDNIWCPTIRTILCFQLGNFPSFPSFLGRFRLLRVLDAVGGSSKELPSQVFELFHLRYLVLICTHNIPSAISNLVNLQTLIIFPSFLLNLTLRQRKARWIVGNAYFTLPLPLLIWRIPQLRHLFGASYMLSRPLDRSNLRLENLQTLSHVKDLVWNEEILQMIPNVKKLGLVYQSNRVFHLHLLKHLYQLEKLKVYGYLRTFSWQRQNPSFPRTLKKLTLVGGGFPWKDMGIIGSLPNLQVLKLINHACNGETWETADDEFPQLRYLLIDQSSLRQWITQSNHFPRLNCLVLRFCEVLREIPGGVGEIPTLELLEVDHINKSLVESAEQIKEDQQSYGNYALQVRLSTTLNSRVYQCTTDDTFLRRR